jgi:hypothetical protein
MGIGEQLAVYTSREIQAAEMKKCIICGNVPDAPSEFVCMSFYRNSSHSSTCCEGKCLAEAQKTLRCNGCGTGLGDGDDFLDAPNGHRYCNAHDYWAYSCADVYKLLKHYGLADKKDAWLSGNDTTDTMILHVLHKARFCPVDIESLVKDKVRAYAVHDEYETRAVRDINRYLEKHSIVLEQCESAATQLMDIAAEASLSWRLRVLKQVIDKLSDEFGGDDALDEDLMGEAISTPWGSVHIIEGVVPEILRELNELAAET